MLTIDNETKTLRFNRGDDFSFIFHGFLDEDRKELYQFQKGDTVTFNIFEKKKYSKGYIFSKNFIVDEPTTDLEISLNRLETEIEVIKNKPNTYYYEFILNGKYTMCGHDEKGAKKVIIYPSEKEKEV